MHDLAVGGLDVVVISVQPNQARSGQCAVLVVVEAAVFRHDAVFHFRFGIGFRFGVRVGVRCGIHDRRIDHLAVIRKAVKSRGQKAVGQRDPVASAVHDLAVGGLDVVVISVQPNQARSGQCAVLVVVEAAVFRNDAVFHFRIGFGLRVGIGFDRRRIDHLTGLVKGILSRGQKTVGDSDPIGSSLDCRAGAGSEIIVGTFDLHQTGHVLNDALHAIVGLAVVIEQPREMLLPDAVFIRGVARCILVNTEDARLDIAMRPVAEVVLVAVQLQPFVAQPLARPAVVRTAGVLDEITAHELAVFEHVLVAVNGLVLVNGLEISRAEVVVAALAVSVREIPPAGLCRALDGVIPRAVQLEQAGDLALAGAGRFVEAVEILVLLVIQAGDLVDTLQSCVIDEVVRHAADHFPARPGASVQNELVCEILIRFTVEVSALGMDDVFRLLIGVNAVLLLERGLTRHAVKRIRAQIDVIADGAGVCNGNRLILAPLCIVLDAHFDAAEDADGIRGLRRDRLALLDEVALDGKHVALIDLCRGQREIVVRHRQPGDVHIDLRIEAELHGHLGLFADALCQLKQQIPCRDVGNVAACDHRQKRLQLFGNLDRHHIQTKDIGDVHRLAGVNDVIAVGHIIAAGDILRVRDLARPCKRPVAACRVVKVEDRLTFTVHGDLDRRADGIVTRDHGGDRDIPQAGFLDAGEHEAAVPRLDGARRIVAQLKCDVVRADRDRVFVVGDDQRKLDRLAVNGVDARLCKFQAGRLDHGERLAADHRFTGQELHLCGALRSGGKHAVLGNRTDVLIQGSPCDVRRELRRASGGADAGGDQRNRSALCQVIVSGGDERMVKLLGGRRCGNDQQRGADRALIAVRGAVDNGELIAALLLGNKRRGAAAVQIDGGHAAGVQHDLCQFFGTAACGERLLTAVKHHHDDLAVRGDAHAGARVAAVVIRFRMLDDRFSVPDEENAAADRLLNLALIGRIVAGRADDGRAVLQDRKEVLIAVAEVFHALHVQNAVRGAVCHVVEVRVGAEHRIVVLHIVLRVGRVGMARLRRRHLVGHARHRPALRRVVGVIVCVNTDVLTGDIHRSDVIDDLLFVRGQRIVDRLRHTGRNGRRVRREHGIVRIFRLGFGLRIRVGIDGVGAIGIARQIEQIICKGVAACLAQRLAIGKIGQGVRALQRTDQGVGAVDLQHHAPDAFLGDHAAETVAQEIRSAAFICKTSREVILSEHAEAPAAVHLRREIKRVQIAVKVGVGEGVIDLVERIKVHAEVSCADVGRENVHIRLRSVHLVGDVHVLGAEHQVGDVAGPAAHVGAGKHHRVRHALHLGVVGNVHRAEHVAEVGIVAVRQVEVFKVFERRRRGRVLRVLLGDIGGKGRIFLAADHLPRAGGVALHARADEVDDERIDILRGIFCRVASGIALQVLQAGKEGRVIRNRRDRGSVFHRLQPWLDIRLCFFRLDRKIHGSGSCKILTRRTVLKRRAIGRVHADRQQRQQHHDSQTHCQISFYRSSCHVLLSLRSYFK